MKQETLEEAVELFFRKKDDKNCTLYKAAKFGAKWQQENSNINALHFEIDALKREIKVFKHQQERMYSEEDMRKAIQKTIILMRCKATEFREHENTVIEQFKKK